MHLDIITLFPNICAPLNESIIKRAQNSGKITLNIQNLRDFTHDSRQTADDRPFGGGAGMVLKPEPLTEAIEGLKTPNAKVILMTPQGARFNQRTAERLSKEEHLIFVCGHYEGPDERVRKLQIDEELSIGDYVLTNGTIAAVVVADAITRLIPGVLGKEESFEKESFGSDNLLDYPQYTRPAEFSACQLPEVLTTGDHKLIEEWRSEQQLIRTISRRPDLLQHSVEIKK